MQLVWSPSSPTRPFYPRVIKCQLIRPLIWVGWNEFLALLGSLSQRGRQKGGGGVRNTQTLQLFKERTEGPQLGTVILTSANHTFVAQLAAHCCQVVSQTLPVLLSLASGSQSIPCSTCLLVGLPSAGFIDHQQTQFLRL